MVDLLPQALQRWQAVESVARTHFQRSGFGEIRTPMMEPTDLFCRGIGEATDVVGKEMYTFNDRGDRSCTLRPEGTAGCVRAVIQGSLTYNGPIKLFYRGPMFRHENVQKGRQRQFHQLGIESFGLTDPASDAEQIITLSRLWKSLGLEKKIRLEINSIGDIEDREHYRKELIDYFEKNTEILDDDAKRRLQKNPMRILDSKNPHMQAMLEKAPKLIDTINEDAKNHFDSLCKILTDNQVNFKLNKKNLDFENIFQAEPPIESGYHFGSRLAIKDNYLFASAGERGGGMIAQDSTNHPGSIIRIHLDGSIPKDNPRFEGKSDWLPEIYQIGIRNPQGLTSSSFDGNI